MKWTPQAMLQLIGIFGVTRKELAHAMNIKESHLSRILSGYYSLDKHHSRLDMYYDRLKKESISKAAEAARKEISRYSQPIVP